ncbi:HoxN/HupN/NixA family nickel/cobalt transporter [Acidisoma sp. S159]|uniref:HoxN/HupN/NixA family nickel/cobalt transporter n=1 Tax=Acidisoma sp. S159 TaxID=1747225 RepID=UPI00131CFE93|nr:HoxN/HupN/NixA family nickel/cobalt transporter [Acidisoma sp. S159]
MIVFRDHTVLLGTALLAYGFGLRHAVDADHIAAIDNVTRKLMQAGQRPVSVGLYFALGHATVVVLASAAIAGAATAFTRHFDRFQGLGGIIGTLVSTIFLFSIAAMNLVVLHAVWRSFRHLRCGGSYVAEDSDLLLNRRGLLARLLRPLFSIITRSWHMWPLGFLFGLGFDTATEVGLLGISATQAAKRLVDHGVSDAFRGRNVLIDTTDGIVMLRTYDWAFVKRLRKLYYNLTITDVSVLTAVAVGSIEALRQIGNQLSLRGWFWDGVGALNDRFGMIGYIIVSIFVAGWLGSAVIYHLRGCDSAAP